MGKYDPREEERIKECLFIIKNNPGIKLAKLAREKRVEYFKLRRRINRIPDQRTKGGHNKRLSPIQEEGFKRYILYLIQIGQPPNKQGLRYGANRILQQCGEIGKGVSKE